MWCGHPPTAIEEYALADIEQFFDALPVIWANMNLQEPPDE